MIGLFCRLHGSFFADYIGIFCRKPMQWAKKSVPCEEIWELACPEQTWLTWVYSVSWNLCVFIWMKIQKCIQMSEIIMSVFGLFSMFVLMYTYVCVLIFLHHCTYIHVYDLWFDIPLPLFLYIFIRTSVSWYSFTIVLIYSYTHTCELIFRYGVATTSRLLKIVGLFCERAL